MDSVENFSGRPLDVFEAFGEDFGIALIEFDVVLRCRSCLQTNSVRNDKCDGLGFGLEGPLRSVRTAPLAIQHFVRKIVFRWAFREMREAEIQKQPGSRNPNLARPGPFESYLLLRDFFQHCERTGVLAASEQQVLTRLKPEGLSAKQPAKLEGSTSEEAVHHRSYRIMARLRKAASRLRSHAHR